MIKRTTRHGKRAFPAAVYLYLPLLLPMVSVSCADSATKSSQLVTFSEWHESLSCLAVRPGGKSLVTGSDDGTLCAWDVASRALAHRISADPSGLKAVALSSDGKLIATGGDDGTVKLWDGGTLALRQSMRCDAGVRSLAFVLNDSLVAAATIAGEVEFWDLSGTRGPGRLKATDDDILASMAVFSGQQSLATVGVDDGWLKVWNVKDRTLILKIATNMTGWRALAATSDGAFFACGDEQGTLKQYDGKTGAQLHGLTAHSGRMVRSLAYSPDNAQLASAGTDRFVELRDTKTFKEITRINSDPHSAAEVVRYLGRNNDLVIGVKCGFVKLYKPDR